MICLAIIFSRIDFFHPRLKEEIHNSPPHYNTYIICLRTWTHQSYYRDKTEAIAKRFLSFRTTGSKNTGYLEIHQKGLPHWAGHVWLTAEWHRDVLACCSLRVKGPIVLYEVVIKHHVFTHKQSSSCRTKGLGMRPITRKWVTAFGSLVTKSACFWTLYPLESWCKDCD